MAKHWIKLFLLLSPFFFSSPGQAFCFTGLGYRFIPPGFYVGAFGGLNGGYDVNCKNIRTHRGYYLGINSGKNIFPNLRLEGDIIWQGNNANTFELRTVKLDHVKGSVNIWSIMTNAIFDFNFPFPGSPSIGAGIGYAYAYGNLSGKLTETNGNFFIQRHIKSSLNQGGFAWQIIADLNFFICRSLKISIEYRFFKMEDRISNHKFGLALTKFF